MSRSARYLVAVLALACAVLSAAWLSFSAAQRGGAPAAPPAGTPAPTDTLRPHAAATTPPPPATIAVTPPLPAASTGGPLAAARAAVLRGDDAGAIALYRQVLATGPRPVDVWLELARTQLRAGQSAGAFATLRALRDTPDGAADPAALFLLAQAELATGDARAALAHLEAYLQTAADRPWFQATQPYALAALGDVYVALGEADLARGAYDQANAAGLPAALGARQPEQLARAQAAGGALDDAVAAFDRLIARTSDESERGRLLYDLAQLLLGAGRADQGRARLRQILLDAIGAPAAPAALEQLLEAGETVDPLRQAFVAYRAGDYARAIPLFRQALDAGATGANHYYLAVALGAEDRPTEALAELDLALADPQAENLWDLARIERVRQLAALGRTGEALAAFDELAARDPGLRWDAADLAMATSRYDEARTRYTDLAAQQRQANLKAKALLRAGVAAYLAGRRADAAAIWNALLADDPHSERRPDLLLLLGKNALAAGDQAGAQRVFDQLLVEYPNTYHAFRARALLAGGADAPVLAPAAYNLQITPEQDAQERAEADAWLADWAGLPTAGDAGVLPTDFAVDDDFQTGAALWRMGLYAPARDAFERVRLARWNDGPALYALALYFRDIGLYRSSMMSARRVVDLSPVRYTLNAPRYLARLAYPVYYADPVVTQARAQQVSPLLAFALIRQESGFESFITSYASAAGLMQVTPGTGAHVASRLGSTAYDPLALYQPDVNLQYGLSYLAEQFARYDGHAYAALAAYNAGPARAGSWYRASGLHDPDLFLALVDLPQPQDYVENIYVNDVVYTQVYGR
jgi:soluble lytic murein transglycosylase